MSPTPDLVCKAIGDATRRSLFERLVREGEKSVTALTAKAGISQPAVSRHLRVLKRAGLIRDRPAGRETYYRAEPKGLAPLIGWMERYAVFWDARFDALENILSRMDN